MRVVIVGAGLSGLAAGATLSAAGQDVVLVDKGRTPGGRLATRRIGGARVDHGAQFFTVRTPEFQRLITELEAAGLVRVWCHGFGHDDGHPRYVVDGGMNALAKHLAVGQDVRCDCLAFAVRSGDEGGWRVELDDGTALDAEAVILTCPVPQSSSLLVTSGAELPTELRTLDYDRTLALLAVLDRPAAVPGPGGTQPGGDLTFVADNSLKGISTVPSLTLHAGPAWSERWWDAEPDATHRALLELAAPWLGPAAVLESQVKRWRFAIPRTVWPEPCWQAATDSPLVLAGDAFAGPRVEGAYRSGLAAAAAVLG